MSAAQQILSHLFRASLPDAPSPFRSILTEAAVSILNKNRMDAEAFAEANVASYWNRLLEQVEEDKKAGLVPFCAVCDKTARLISSASTPYLVSTSVKSKRVGALLQSRPLILKAVDDLTHREYEALGCFVVKLIGAESHLLMPGGDEGGIDFLACVRFIARCHVFSGFGREVRIVGQCKKYESKVQVNLLDQFIKTVENVRHRSSRVDHVLPAWFHASRGPIVGWMIAHRGFQSGALDEGKKHGVVLSDSRDMAEVITLSRRFCGDAKPDARAAGLKPELAPLLSSSTASCAPVVSASP